MALADNYAGLLTLLDRYVDLKYMPTLAEVRHIQKVDVSFVEESVCINDKLAVEEIKEIREKSAVVVALGGCACYGNITRFPAAAAESTGARSIPADRRPDQGRRVDLPRCVPTPQMIRNVAVMAYLLLKGTKEQKDLATAYLTPLMKLAAGCEALRLRYHDQRGHQPRPVYMRMASRFLSPGRKAALTSHVNDVSATRS